MTDFKCPYCKREHNWDDTDLWEDGYGETTFECYECEREFDLYIEFEPVITVRCSDGQHNLMEYDEAYESLFPLEKDKYPALDRNLWCDNCGHSEAKEK